MRPGELVKIETANIDIESRTMKGGIKTKAGKNRVIPINKKILPFIGQEEALFYFLTTKISKCPISHITIANSRL